MHTTTYKITNKDLQGTLLNIEYECHTQYDNLYEKRIWKKNAYIYNMLLLRHSVVSNSLRPHGLQHAMLPCPSLSPRACSNSCPLSRWCHPTISSSISLFFSFPQSFSGSGSFRKSWLLASGGQSIGASSSASVLPMNIHGWFPLGLTCLISLQSKGLSRVFSSTRVQKHQFFGAQPSLGPTLTSIHDYWKNRSLD